MANISIPDSTHNCKDFTPETYGRLVTVGPVVSLHNGTRKRHYQQCLCACGTLKQYRLSSLRSGDTQSCGCLMREISSAVNGKHRRCGTPEYRAWASMLARCLSSTHHAFRHYGGRGISICERWEKFENFLTDMGLKPSTKHSLDRIDNSGNYEPSNCRWATWAEQANNKRSCHMITIGQTTDTLINWCRNYGISYNCVQARLRLGWDINTALTKSVEHRKKRQSSNVS